MTLLIDGHSLHYEMENLCRVFFPHQKINVVCEPCDDKILAYTGIKKRENGVCVTARLKIKDKEKENTRMISFKEAEDKRELERCMGVLLFSLFVELCGYRPKWGILTGVRPVKLFGRFVSELGEEKAAAFFEKNLLVSHEKTELARATLKNERKILSVSAPESFSLYIGIPFCPTRCAYCSFVSSSVDKTFKLIPDYVELLCKEIKHTAKIAEKLKLRLQCVYMGGGTPTTLSVKQLGAVLDTVRGSFDLSECREITVEAGRPDTITKDNLDAMKTRGVTRISINPQTLSDDVLRAIGRKHTTAQTFSAFALARERGFDNINMDLIAGLPRDNTDSFKNTVDGVAGLSPESITVHTLALKRAARLFQDSDKEEFSGDAETVGCMLEYADSSLMKNGYAPYYLYRQSRMTGNLENTGWAKPGFESFYNVFIMEECQTILACGAGAATKIKDPHSDQLKRIFNFKYPYEYISRYQEIIARKDRVEEIYDSFEK